LSSLFSVQYTHTSAAPDLGEQMGPSPGLPIKKGPPLCSCV